VGSPQLAAPPPRAQGRGCAGWCGTRESQREVYDKRSAIASPFLVCVWRDRARLPTGSLVPLPDIAYSRFRYCVMCGKIVKKLKQNSKSCPLTDSHRYGAYPLLARSVPRCVSPFYRGTQSCAVRASGGEAQSHLSCVVYGWVLSLVSEGGAFRATIWCEILCRSHSLRVPYEVAK